jgi:hypothetical protein
MWSKVDEMLINAYVVLVMANRATFDSNDKSGKRIVPEKYRAEVEIRIAEKTIDILQ